VGRRFELAAALEDAALLSGERPDEALRIYTTMSARWDMARTSTAVV